MEMQTSDKKRAELEEVIGRLLRLLDADPNREGLKRTPSRVARSYEELLDGYGRQLDTEITLFENKNGYDDIIYSGPINYVSMCEHHLLPFFGKAHIAYVPNRHIAGLSKLARAIEIFSHRLTEQETITVHTRTELDRLLAPKGAIVYLTGHHLCNTVRGVKQTQSLMKTVSKTGVFNDTAVLAQFFHLLEAE